MQHTFWLILFSSILVWYFVVAIVVAVRGFRNIVEMLDQLKNQN